MIHTNEFYVITCIWGKGRITKYEHFIYKVRKTAVFPVGWKWAWPKKNIYQVKAYPSISFGQNPWSATSTITQLPIRVDQIKKITVDYEILHCGSGKYNLAFDMWFTKTAGKTNPPEPNIVREVMIWQDKQGQSNLPSSWYDSKVSIDGEEYKLYRIQNATEKTGTGSYYTRDFMAFIKQTPEYMGQTNIHKFLHYLAEKGYILTTEYLRNVDLGNEICYGEGETVIKNFTLTVK
jgi:hypothetical protein